MVLKENFLLHQIMQNIRLKGPKSQAAGEWIQKKILEQLNNFLCVLMKFQMC